MGIEGFKMKSSRWRMMCSVAMVAASVAHAQTLKVLTVGANAKAEYATVQAAIDHAPAQGADIRIAPGKYREKIAVHAANVHLIGTGATAADTVLSWNDSAGTAGGTGKSASVTATGEGFEAENLTIENTWELENQSRPQGAQAVALLLNADRAVVDHVRLLGAQDTLYSNSSQCRSAELSANHTPCRASRQYYSDCYIEGHVDFIFGDAKAVFDHCELHPRFHSEVMLTAQSKYYAEEDSGYYFLHCSVTGTDDGARVMLGRPWRDFSTVVFFDTDFERTIAAEGWSDWAGRLRTSTYREYDSHGPGANGGHRVITSPTLTPAERAALAPDALLAGDDHWDPVAAAMRLRQQIRLR
jgi:pectinesterase